MIERQVEEHYNQISGKYNDFLFPNLYYQKVAQAEYQFVLNRIKAGTSVLEIGPGTGRFTRQLMLKAARVTAVDVAQNMLDQLTENIAAPNLLTRQLSAYQISALPEYGKFNCVVCMRVLPHLERPFLALEAMAGAIHADGDLLFDLWNPNSFVGLVRRLFRRPSYVFTRLYPYARMLAMIHKAGLEVVEALAWGYPRLGAISLDTLGNRYLKPLGYSITFHAHRKRS